MEIEGEGRLREPSRGCMVARGATRGRRSYSWLPRRNGYDDGQSYEEQPGRDISSSYTLSISIRISAATAVGRREHGGDDRSAATKATLGYDAVQTVMRPPIVVIGGRRRRRQGGRCSEVGVDASGALHPAGAVLCSPHLSSAHPTEFS